MATKKIGDIEIFDGGDRKTRVLPENMRAKKENKERNAYKKDSYATEDILRSKHDNAFKNGEVKRVFSAGISFDKNGKIIR